MPRRGSGLDWTEWEVSTRARAVGHTPCCGCRRSAQERRRRAGEAGARLRGRQARPAPPLQLSGAGRNARRDAAHGGAVAARGIRLRLRLRGRRRLRLRGRRLLHGARGGGRCRGGRLLPRARRLLLLAHPRTAADRKCDCSPVFEDGPGSVNLCMTLGSTQGQPMHQALHSSVTRGTATSC